MAPACEQLHQRRDRSTSRCTAGPQSWFLPEALWRPTVGRRPRHRDDGLGMPPVRERRADGALLGGSRGPSHGPVREGAGGRATQPAQSVSRWLTLAVLCVPLLIVSLDNTV